MNIRPAEPKDLGTILDIINVLNINIPGFVWNNKDFVLKQIGQKEYFLCEHDNRVVGIISLRKRKNKVNIETLGIKPESQRSGFGAGLIEFAKNYTQEQGFSILHAYSFKEYQAVNFYLKQGFRLLDQKGSYQGHEYDCFEIKLS